MVRLCGTFFKMKKNYRRGFKYWSCELCLKAVFFNSQKVKLEVI